MNWNMATVAISKRLMPAAIILLRNTLKDWNVFFMQTTLRMMTENTLCY